VFATASRSRPGNLTNVVVRQTMRTGSGSTCAITVHVFDIINVLQASGLSLFAEPLSRIPGVNTQRTFQNVCSYYDVRFVVRYDWIQRR
jgi:hypothetical protein